MRVTDIPKSIINPLMNISHDVGYSPRTNITISLLRQVSYGINMAFLSSTGWRGRLRDTSFRGYLSPLKMMKAPLDAAYRYMNIEQG